jgi:hypothetical protein
MSGWLTYEEADAQALAAAEKYNNASTNGQQILLDRFENLNDNYNPPSYIYDNDMTSLNSASAYNSNGDYIGEVYNGGNSIVPVNGTVFDNYIVGQLAIDDNNVYGVGGHIPGAGIGYDTNGPTGYVDSLVLAEASKMTGEKWF